MSAPEDQGLCGVFFGSHPCCLAGSIMRLYACHRWCLWSLAQGDTLRSWHAEAFCVVEDGVKYLLLGFTTIFTGCRGDLGVERGIQTAVESEQLMAHAQAGC